MRGFSHPNVTRSIGHILQQLSCDSGVDVFLYLKLHETCLDPHVGPHGARLSQVTSSLGPCVPCNQSLLISTIAWQMFPRLGTLGKKSFVI